MQTEANKNYQKILNDTPTPKQIQTWEWEGGSVSLEGAKNAGVSTFLPSLLTRDYELMDEAARRLLDGTCCLLDEEKVSAMELFSKLRIALMDHIQFEEGTVFKNLDLNGHKSKEFILSMKAEHRELLTLIAECERELQESHGVAFRVILRAFLASFRRHRTLEVPFWYKQETTLSDDENLERMRLRAGEKIL